MPVGHLTRDQLLRAWIDSVDPEHARGVLSDPDSAAAIEQLCEQLAVVSLAVEETAQEMYLLHGSGQSFPSAAGAARSHVTLTVTRSTGFDRRLVFEPGTLVEELQTDHGGDGGVEVRTGRRYALRDRVVFFPGEAGPFTVEANAERQGRGFDHPAPGSIRGLVAPGSGLFNDGASVTPSTDGPHVLTAAPRPDAPVPEHVGQTVEMTSGANAGQRRRVVGYVRPNPPADAGGLLLARDARLLVSGLVGAFLTDEAVSLPGGGEGVLIAIRVPHAIVERTNGVPTAPGLMTGAVSGATVTVDVVEVPDTMTAEVGTAGWKVLDVVQGFEVAFANALSPTGGRDAVLDSLGFERGALRAPGEDDELFRSRASEPSDAVTPNAVLRAANRTLAHFGAEAVLREAGAAGLPGFFLDADALDYDGLAVLPQAAGFEGGELVFQAATLAVGTAITQSPAGLGPVLPPVLVGVARVHGTFANGSPIVGASSGATIAAPAFSGGLRLADVHKVAFSYVDMRAYFLIGTGHRGVGEFGCAFDSHPYGFLDSSPALSFCDGFAATSAAAAQRVWQAVDEVRPAGSGFTLIEEAPPA